MLVEVVWVSSHEKESSNKSCVMTPDSRTPGTRKQRCGHHCGPGTADLDTATFITDTAAAVITTSIDVWTADH